MSEEPERSVPPGGNALSGPGESPPRPAPAAADAEGETGALKRAERIYRELRALLRGAMRERLGVPGSSRPLRLNLSLQVNPDGGPEAPGEACPERTFAEELLKTIGQAVDEQVHRGAPFPPGRVRCFWCASFECPHSVPASPRSVFAGYGPTGLPLWTDLATLALERRDPRIDDFYRDPPIPISIFQSGEDLVSAQLAIYGKRSGVYRILGQVSVGYLSLPAGPRAERVQAALTLQAVQVDRGRRGLHLNVIGRLDDGTDLWRVLEAEPDSRLSDALGAARERLAESGFRRRRGRSLDHEARGALGRLARNLDRIFRQQVRRTKHSQDRHLNRERPAAAALHDAINARAEEIFRDVLESTWVVLGPRSRVHIFNDLGQHITSVVYPGETVRRRTAQGKWRAAPPEVVRGFREAVERSRQSTVD